MMATSVVRVRLAATVSLVALSLAAPSLADQAQEQAATVDDIIVTAQKREESIQSVPIAVSAFSAETLDALKIEGGSELLRAIPNVTFSKNNFSMYNFSIRGIGTKSISSASDPAVAVSFNNAPMIRNRLFESEYLDVNRVEVLRGPQGTLYGRNATAGVVNMIPNLPADDFDALLKGEVGNFGSVRGQVMLNLPLSDTFAVRGAASFTKRDGFDRNTYRDTDINGRDLHSFRVSALWEPSGRFSSSLIWERFSENDNRSRTGKQLCTTDNGPTQVGTVAVTAADIRAKLSQGCLPGSLYDEAAYGTPNAAGMAQNLMISGNLTIGRGLVPGTTNRYQNVAVMPYGINPFANVVQSRNLREVSTYFDPVYIASNDVLQFNFSYDVADAIKFVSQTMYTSDSYYASQDYARYVSNDIFNDSNGLVDSLLRPIVGSTITPGGYYTDPQLGGSRKMLSMDLSRSDNSQFYQEFRLQSSGEGKFNFNLGANYINFNTDDKYYVFNNTFTLMAEYFYNRDTSDPGGAIVTNRCVDGVLRECVFVEYAGISDLQDEGHNYFLSKNVVNTESWAVFGEAYLDLSETLRLTLGARYTDDIKTTTPYPSQLLLGKWEGQSSSLTGGKVVRGLVADPDVKQNWDALTGRAVIDWKPNDDVMFYASASRGYKGGGTNPPRADLDTTVVQYQPLPSTFEPEYVNALELGAKASMLDGSLRVNASAFYYDYEDYQVSQIVDRISLNENFDAESMGIEFEAVWRPTRQLRIDGNLGYLKTRVGKGEQSIDVMNRTQGNDDWMLVRPWAQVPSNCIAPKKHVESILKSPFGAAYWVFASSALCGGAQRYGSFHPDFPSTQRFWELFRFTYNPLTDAPNAGRGFAADLSGNELPNAPRWTGNLGAQYTFEFDGWDLTLRGDYYRQSSSYFRVYNTEYDRLKGWGSANLSFTLENSDRNIILQGYVKNIMDDAPIVDAFTNSDDSMLTTNVFTLDPRVIGFSLTRRY